MVKRYFGKVILVILCCGMMIGCNSSKPIQPKKIALNEKSYENDTQAWLDIYLDAYLPSGYMLPDQTPNGEKITWEIIQGAAAISNNKLEKKEDAKEYEPLILQATLPNQKSYQFDHLLLLDPYVGYLISYFSKKGDEKESLKLAYTYNGYYWFNLNEGHSLVTPTIGTTYLRDPSIIRKKDGSFTVIATQGYETSSIYAYDTNDFITFSNERLLQVNKNSNELPMSETQAWAPEGFYDRTLDQYVIYWSSVNDHKMFYNLSPDLKSISYPNVLLDVGYEIIDGTIIKQGAEYWMIVKDEREPYQEHSQLSFTKPSDSWRTFSELEEPFSDHENEGPMVLKDLEGDGYYIYYDNYTKVWFRAMYMKDLHKQSFEPLKKEDLMIPLYEPGHSSAIPVTWKELERLFEVYAY